MLRKNGRLAAYLLVLAMVLGATYYFHQMNTTPPAAESLRDVPPLGQVPSEEQIHGSAPPPAPKRK
ncbi:MAG TPA: hypothetical protein VGM51_13900 [Armatimonadota bacterium]|jgi:hypothetical protein